MRSRAKGIRTAIPVATPGKIALRPHVDGRWALTASKHAPRPYTCERFFLNLDGRSTGLASRTPSARDALARLSPDERVRGAIGRYSYRSASIGSKREALTAGTIPKNTPTEAEKPIPKANDHHGSEMGKPEK